ncbi:hypothetical protein B566_EDAN001088 [Ephemera danica]|nr:hypothetical protein B566_EDAN001088 [Ephemera danica]
MDTVEIIRFIIWISMYGVFSAIFVIVLLGFLLMKRFNKARRLNRAKEVVPTIAFFHPYCNAGGGGERVLWCAIRALQEKYPEAKFVVYTGDIEASPEEILNRAYKRFNIELPRKVHFAYLRRRAWVEASRWPHFTMIGQNLCIDTMGYTFALSLFRGLGGCRTACYVHYPTITPDMLQYVAQRHGGSGQAILKLQYYRLFAMLYRWAGSSVAQYRPEKDHPLQLRSLYALRELLKGEGPWENVRLVFAGSCRHAEDNERVKDLMALAKHLALDEFVEFKINLSHEDLMEEFKKATVGLHAMWNEHFGIGVVECLAAGLLTVAHDSGGPQMDIIEVAEGSRTGWLASDEMEYARTLYVLMKLPTSVKQTVREAARSSVERFSTAEFNKAFLNVISPMIDKL